MIEKKAGLNMSSVVSVFLAVLAFTSTAAHAETCPQPNSRVTLVVHVYDRPTIDQGNNWIECAAPSNFAKEGWKTETVSVKDQHTVNAEPNTFKIKKNMGNWSEKFDFGDPNNRKIRYVCDSKISGICDFSVESSRKETGSHLRSPFN